MKKSLLLVVFSLVLLASCKKESEQSLNTGSNYFPVAVNNYWIYQVDSIVYDNFNNTITPYHYQVKIVMDSSFVDQSGRTSFWTKRYFKTDTTSWTFVNNFSYTKTAQRIEIVDQDVPFIPLIFPVIAGSSWNPNAMNSLEQLEAEYTDVDYRKIIQSNSYDSCAFASYIEDVNLIQEKIYYEIYARGVGMIYRKHTDKEIQNNATRGYQLEYFLTEYHIENEVK
jgi:hypothetical protein